MAITLSEKLDSELHVAYVEPHPDHFASPESITYHPEYRHELRKIAERDAHDKLGKEAQKIRDMGEVTETHARVGRPDAEIVRLAEEIGAGLVVLGSRGLGPIRRAVMGSVSSSVVRHAHCPVMVVRGETRDGDATVGPIVVAIDGSEEAKLAARAAAELSGGTGSEIHLVFVLPTPARMYGHHFYSADMEKQLLERARMEAREFLDAQAEGVRSGGGRVAQTYLATGRSDEEIVELAEETGAAMVVMGSRGLGGVRRALMGSVSESVVRHAHCPVLVIRDARDRATNGDRGVEE